MKSKPATDLTLPVFDRQKDRSVRYFKKEGVSLFTASNNNRFISPSLNCLEIKDDRYLQTWNALDGTTFKEMVKKTKLSKREVHLILNDLLKQGLCVPEGDQFAPILQLNNTLIEHLYLEVAQQCRYSCTHCQTSTKNREMSADLAQQLLQNLLPFAAFNLKITLGYGSIANSEAVKIFLDQISNLKAQNLFRPDTVLWTSEIHDPKHPTKIHGHRVNFVLLDIDGCGTDFKLDNPEGVAFTFTATKGNMETCKAYIKYLNRTFKRGRIYIRFPLEKEQQPDIEGFRKWCWLADKSPRTSFYDDVLFRNFESLKRKRPYPHPLICGAGQKRFFVDVDGNLFPCERLKGKKLMGNLIKNNFTTIINNPATASIHAENRTVFEKCSQSCSFAGVCGGCLDEMCCYSEEMLKTML